RACSRASPPYFFISKLTFATWPALTSTSFVCLPRVSCHTSTVCLPAGTLSIFAAPPASVTAKNGVGRTATHPSIQHNIHTYSTANPTINKAQPKFKKVMTEKLEKPEYVKLTCDVHSWMLGWVAVTPGPAAVTDANGVAKIENVPPGKQTVEVWHA